MHIYYVPEYRDIGLKSYAYLKDISVLCIL